jgi:protein-tyrosine kinase
MDFRDLSDASRDEKLENPEKEAGIIIESNRRPRDEIPRRNDGAYTASMLSFITSLDAALASVTTGKVILFCSARAGEGKSTVVGELTAALAGASRHRVAVVDAGTRHDASTEYGRGSCVTFDRLVASLGRDRPTNAPVVSPGQTVFATVATKSVGMLLEPEVWKTLGGAFDYVLVDMPSLAEFSLALAVSKYADGVVLVIESGRTRWPIVQNADDQLKRAGASVLGAFLNKRRYYVPKGLYNRL